MNDVRSTRRVPSEDHRHVVSVCVVHVFMNDGWLGAGVCFVGGHTRTQESGPASVTVGARAYFSSPTRSACSASAILGGVVFCRQSPHYFATDSF